MNNPRKLPLDASSKKEEQIVVNSAKTQLTILSYGIKSSGKGVATKTSRQHVWNSISVGEGNGN